MKVVKVWRFQNHFALTQRVGLDLDWGLGDHRRPGASVSRNSTNQNQWLLYNALLRSYCFKTLRDCGSMLILVPSDPVWQVWWWLAFSGQTSPSAHWKNTQAWQSAGLDRYGQPWGTFDGVWLGGGSLVMSTAANSTVMFAGSKILSLWWHAWRGFWRTRDAWPNPLVES